MQESTECHIMDGDEDDDASVHSAISNASDFEEDEEAEYLAMELVHYLPADKSAKLFKNMRTKEKAVQDLLHRNRMLLESCQKLDDENQTLSERLKEAEKAPPPASAAPSKAAAPPPAANVDSSIFLKLERGKEEQILALRGENDRLKAQVRRLSDCGQQLEEALVESRKELKKVQQGQKKPEARGAGGGAAHVDRSVLDEEERIYRELQGENSSDLITKKMQQRQAENRAKVQAVLQALLSDDLQRIKRWSSDVAAVMLAVEGMEVQLKHGHKDHKETKESKDSKAQKKGKAAASSHSGSSQFSSEQIQQVSAQLLDDFDSMRSQLEDAEKVQLSLEQTAQGLHDEAEQVVATSGLDESLTAAEREAEWMRSHNAAWVEHAQALSLEPTVSSLGRTESAVRSLLSSAPPGLIPPNVEGCLQDACERMMELSSQLGRQADALAALQDESISFGRRVKVLQNLHRTLRSDLQGSMADELRRSAGAIEKPLERMRAGLRQQNEAIAKARARTSSTLDGLAEAARRAVAADSASSSADPRGGSEPAVPDAVFGGFREVRSMGKSLIANFDEGGKALSERMDQVVAALYGEAAPADGDKSRTASGSGAAEEPRATASEAKRKRGKKKGGRAEPEHAAESGQAVVAAGGAEAQPAERGGGSRPNVSAVAGGADALPSRARGELDEDAKLRAEFHEVFRDSKDPAGSPQRKGADNPVERSGSGNVLTGPELLHELEALRDESEALEARMAERLKARSSGAAEDEASGGSGAKPKAQRRKKMYA